MSTSEGPAPLAGTPKGVEAIILSVVYKKLVTRLIDRFVWIRSGENVALYADIRSLMNYVKTLHGGVFRRVVLSGMLESTLKIVKVEATAPGAGPATDSNRESPGAGSCSVVDETEKQLAYKKSVFRRRHNTVAAPGVAAGGNMVRRFMVPSRRSAFACICEKFLRKNKTLLSKKFARSRRENMREA